MALRTGNTPAFEQMEDTSAPAAILETSGPKIEPTMESKPAGTAVAAPKATAVGQAVKFKAALADKENVIPPGDLAFGTYDKITAAGGGVFMLEGETSLGEDITLEVISWNRRWVASPGANDDEATKLAKFSTDGKHLDGEDTLLLDYIRYLKETAGYENAKVKEYFAIWGEMVTSTKQGDVAPADRHIYELQCSPETVKKFNGWRMEHGMKVARGIFPESSLVKCHANIGKNGKNTFGYATFNSVVTA